MEDSLLFRPADGTEKEPIFRLYESVKGSAFCVWNEYYPDRGDLDRDFAAGNLFVLTEREEIVGAISIVPENELDGLPCRTEPNAAEVARVVIRPDRQGNGYARLLLDGVLRVLLQRGVTAVHLSAAKKNPPALKLYQGFGFRFAGEVFQYGNDYFLCEKSLR